MDNSIVQPLIPKNPVLEYRLLILLSHHPLSSPLSPSPPTPPNTPAILPSPSFFLSHLSCSAVDRWGTTVDFTTCFLHSAFRRMIFHSRPVHSLMLSSHRFLCLPLQLPPWTVPCRIVLASPDGHVTCLYHFSLHLFTEVRRSSYGLISPRF